MYNYVCTKSQFTVCWEVKIHCALCVHKLNVCWEVRIYFTDVCTQAHKDMRAMLLRMGANEDNIIKSL